MLPEYLRKATILNAIQINLELLLIASAILWLLYCPSAIGWVRNEYAMSSNVPTKSLEAAIGPGS